MSKELTKTRIVYTLLAVLICGCTLLFFVLVLKNIFGSKSSVLKKPVLFGWFLLFIPNFLVALVFFIQHMQILVVQMPPQHGVWCTFVAFVAIIAMVALNGSCLTIASTMYCIVKFGPKKVWKIIAIGNFMSWCFGVAVGIWYLLGNSLGPFRGLYCCIREEKYNGARVFLIFFTFVLSILLQSALYFSAFRHIRRTEQNARNQTNLTTPMSRLRSSSPLFQSTNTHDLANEQDSPLFSYKGTVAHLFMRKGLIQVSIFYFCWLWISVDSIIVFSGHKQVPLVSSLVAALLAKMNGVLHGYVMLQHLSKAKRKIRVYSVA